MTPHTAPHDTATDCRVRLAGHDVSLVALRAHPEKFVGLFGRARAEMGHAQCLCRTDPVPRLVIRNRNGRYHLASWPAQGHLHAPGCPWYHPDPALSGRGGYTADAIVSTLDGTAIRLSLPLITRSVDPATPGPAAALGTDTATAARSSVSVLALAHFLWEEARLSVWERPSPPRIWRVCHERLVTQVRGCVINGVALEDALYVVPPFHPDVATRNATAFARFSARVTTTAHARRRGLVLGEVREMTPGEYSVKVRLAHLRQVLFASHALAQRVRASYRHAFTDEAHERGRRVALCVVEHSERGYLIVVDMAVMLVTAAYLPVDSSHELRMADALVRAGRTFIKPLRYDRTAAVFPDFVLVDTEPRTVVEVWGIQGKEEYEQRKRTKQTYYQSGGQPLVEWDVRDPLPDLSLKGPR